MADEKGKLYLFEAIELRNTFDRHIKLLESTLYDRDGRDSFMSRREEDVKEPADDFNAHELEEELKKIQTKRVKLNQAIQAANFTNTIQFDGDEITLAEALELRKNLLAELEAMKERVRNSAYKKIIHKEERDIVREPKHSFTKVYAEYEEKLLKLRNLVNLLHKANHNNVVDFREE